MPAFKENIYKIIDKCKLIPKSCTRLPDRNYHIWLEINTEAFFKDIEKKFSKAKNFYWYEDNSNFVTEVLKQWKLFFKELWDFINSLQSFVAINKVALYESELVLNCGNGPSFSGEPDDECPDGMLCYAHIRRIINDGKKFDFSKSQYKRLIDGLRNEFENFLDKIFEKHGCYIKALHLHARNFTLSNKLLKKLLELEKDKKYPLNHLDIGTCRHKLR